MADTFVPTGFIVPFEFATEQFRLEPLGPTHNDADYEAWSSSADHIHSTPGWENSAWPDARTAADNLRDLQRHADDFRNRTGFTYTVLEPQRSDVVGMLLCLSSRRWRVFEESVEVAGEVALEAAGCFASGLAFL